MWRILITAGYRYFNMWEPRAKNHLTILALQPLSKNKSVQKPTRLIKATLALASSLAFLFKSKIN